MRSVGVATGSVACAYGWRRLLLGCVVFLFRLTSIARRTIRAAVLTAQPHAQQIAPFCLVVRCTNRTTREQDNLQKKGKILARAPCAVYWVSAQERTRHRQAVMGRVSARCCAAAALVSAGKVCLFFI